MVNIKVSEKTRELLKCVKKEEQIKTLDGTIRYLLSAFDWLKMTSIRRRGLAGSRDTWLPILAPDDVLKEGKDVAKGGVN